MYKLIEFDHPLTYQSGLKMQMEAFEKVRNKECKGVIMLLQHQPIYTIGTSGGWDNLLLPVDFFDRMNIDVIETRRGGNITFHGPGQIVMYPILDMTELSKDTHWYIQSLEECVITVLHQYGISGVRKPEHRGVWIDDLKISAVGVAIKHWITFHGLAFNINVDKNYFDWINPCGIKEFGICSLEDYVMNTNINKVADQLTRSFEDIFKIKLQKENQSYLDA